jgi:polyisoprenoid-binding protein YceI
MNHKTLTLSLLLAATVLISGCFALAEPEESSGTVSAPTLAASEPAMEEVQDAPTTAPAAEQEEPTAAPPTAEPTPTTEPYPAEETAFPPQPTEPPPGYPATEDTEEGLLSAVVYEIDPARSEARFTINEVLRGAPKTVIGISKNLGGQIALDLANPAAAQVGTILINARDFKTDNEWRNRAIANEILLTNEHEFITFEPTTISGLPESAVIGETYPLQITGDLTIAGQTREVTFDAEVTPLSENELQGTAALDILYADFGLTIPFSESVDSVEDNLLMELDFIAVQ